MATYTSNKKLIKPANGEYPDTWDVPVNNDWDIIDKALGSTVTYTITTTDISMTVDDAQNQRILLTGTPGATRNVIIPLQYLSSTTAVGGMWIVDNQTNATQNILTEVGGSQGVSVIAGRRAIVFSDGTNVRFADDARIIGGNGISVSGSTVSLNAPVTVPNGGTGLATLPDGYVLLGNGTDVIDSVAPGNSGNVLTSNGSTWISAPGGGGGGGGITSINFASVSGMGFTYTPSSVTTSGQTVTLGGTLSIANGGTGVSTIASGIVKSTGTTLVGNSQVFLGGTSTPIDVVGQLQPANGGTGVTSINSTVQSALGTAPQGSGGFLLSTGPLSISGSFTTTGALLGQSLGVTGSGNAALINFNGSGSQYLSVNGSNNTLSAYVNGAIFSATPANFAPSANLLVNGGIPYANQANFTIISDSRTKKNVQPYTKSVVDVTALTPVSFQYNGQYGTRDDGVTRVGLIAQDVLPTAMSALVGTRVYKDPQTGQSTTLYDLNPSDLVFALINTIKALDARVKALEAKVGP